MADSKISALPASTTPLAGTEVLPIVQSSTTKQVSVANLTAGRTQTSNGIVQGTAATGYNFTANTPAAGNTSRLLNWYEEGTWTPSDQSGAGLTFTGVTATYTRIGRLVTCNLTFKYPVTASVATATIGGLPFNSGSYGAGSIQGFFSITTATLTSRGLYGAANTNQVVIDKNNGTSAATNLDMSNATSYATIIYQV
jgi:hypothetical protein